MQTEGVSLELRQFLKSCDTSHREVITSSSDVFIPECIMLCEATQHMLDLKLAYYESMS